MILKRILIIILVATIISLVGAGLLLYGNRENNVDIYNSKKESNIYKSEENIVLEETTILAENKIEEVQKEEQLPKVDIDVSKNNNEVQNNVVTTKENKATNVTTTQMDKTINVVTPQPSQTANVQNVVVNKSQEIVIQPNKKVEQKVEQPKEEIVIQNKQEQVVQKEETKEEVKQEIKEEPKEDVYTFKRNDTEIQKMINMAKSIIRTNKDNRCSGLVDKVDSINFITQKAGNLFYPLFQYRIENIVIDNFFPEFYVYAEDIYKNGVYLRTEYYFN